MKRQGYCRRVLGCTLLMLLMNSIVWADETAKPNIIVVMTDDQGYGDTGATGNPVIKTPALDAMAARSASMDTFYVSPVCAPTRASLMTGRYNYRTRVVDTFAGRALMDPQEVTLAEVLRDHGYATGIFGKWHLGDSFPLRPMDQGFEESLVHRGGGIGQPSDPVGGEGRYTDPVLFHNGQREEMKGYCTDIYFSAAMDWIERSSAEGKPFFAYIATNAPHAPFHGIPDELYEQYKEMNLAPVMLGKPNQQAADTLSRIFAMITNIDQNMGKLFERLETLGLTERTLVIFLTDNGPNSARYVGPFRGMKTEVHEGGVRTIFWAHWPGTLSSETRCDLPVAHIDLMPTLLEATGIKPPAGVEMDGQSFWRELRGQPARRVDRTLFIQTHRGETPVLYHHFFARRGRWKLVNPSGFGRETLPGPPGFELYDLYIDPDETKDLSAEYPEIVERLKSDYEEWFRDVSTTREDNYAPPRIYVGSPEENPVVLTRQDWRHRDGRPWAPDSNGIWQLHVAEAGAYEIRLRFPEMPDAGVARLKMNDQMVQGLIEAGDTAHVFEDVHLQRGPLTLKSFVESANAEKGAWHAVVTRVD